MAFFLQLCAKRPRLRVFKTDIGISDVVLCVLLILVLGACASQGIPTGGLKDETQPNLLFVAPKDQSVNVKSRMVEMQFDEYIKVGNLQTALNISPYTEIEYKTTVRKNRLSIVFEEDLKPNTTYTLDFGEAIQDITEGNKALNLRLAFSTGPVIDSLTLKGKVFDLLTGRPLKTCTVSLYDAKDTMDIDQDKPLYITRTDTSGVYQFKNLRAGEYKLYALSEAKPDLIYKGKDELIAFLDANVPLYQSFAGFNLHTVYYDLKPLQVASGRSRKQYFELKLNKKVKDYALSFLDPTLDTVIYHQMTNELITFYHKDNLPTDTLLAKLDVTDSVGNRIQDTVKIKFNESKKAKLVSPIAQELPATGTKILKDQPLPISIKFSKPITGFITDSLLYQQDKDSIWSKFADTDFKWNHNRTQLDITHVFSPQEKIDISARLGTFLSVEGDTVPSKVINYSVASIEEFGSILGEIKGNASNYIVQIINELNVVEQEQIVASKFNFQRLVPGNKKVRVFVDRNNNNQWDKGSFPDRKMPEKVVVTKQVIPLKANWELIIDPIDTEAIDF
ncbi:MAG: hypothetical protein EAZ57_11350 [Cytophagales bacterium]|nr:MAG: hypothetical protein EAZ67_12285 [Cytophagales bacterium]TAF59408.1 MAG: hypothetical protein EAZ57_11350 [Cytophagales bacterium]